MVVLAIGSGVLLAIGLAHYHTVVRKAYVRTSITVYYL